MAFQVDTFQANAFQGILMLSVDAGNYVLSGQIASFLYEKGLLARSGVYILTGQDAKVLYKRLRTVIEYLGIRETELISKKTYSGGDEIVRRILSSIWQIVPKVSTIWQGEEKRKLG